MVPITAGSTLPIAPFADAGSDFLGVFQPRAQRSVDVTAPAPLVGRSDLTSIAASRPGESWDDARLVVTTSTDRFALTAARSLEPAGPIADAADLAHHASALELGSAEMGSVELRIDEGQLAACTARGCEALVLGPEQDFFAARALTARPLNPSLSLSSGAFDRRAGFFQVFAAGDIEGWPTLLRLVVRVDPSREGAVEVGTVEALGTGGLGDELRDVWVDPTTGTLWLVSNAGLFALDTGGPR
jgi:hypothetical protein